MRVLYLEPFHGGSHAAFTAALTRGVPATWTVLTLPGRHWKWRMRGAAPYLAGRYRRQLEEEHDLLFASSYLALQDLVALVPSLSRIPSVLYFHENQLAYPVRSEYSGERDLHFGFTQLVAAATATRCLFNSRYNMESFLAEGSKLLSRMPDARPMDLLERVEARSSVLPVPLDLPEPPPHALRDPPSVRTGEGPLLLWNHRWEHDKDPETFFGVLAELARRGVPFRVAVCGERSSTVPPAFQRARAELGSRVVQLGYVADRADYLDLLARAHLVVSTARQEFFGISVMEAVAMGAMPLVPDDLAYPELYPPEYRYSGREELLERLEGLCLGWTRGELDLKADRSHLVRPYGPALLDRYRAFLEGVAAEG